MRNFKTQFSKEMPIFCQIKDLILKEIIKKTWKPGEKIPSVRELAVKLKVNPNTVQKAYSSLEKEGIIFVKRGQGYFVIEDEKFIENLKKKIIEEQIQKFIENLESLGVDISEIKKYFENYLKNKEVI